MARLTIVWDPSPGGNLEHIAEHDLTQDDVEDVLVAPFRHRISRSSGRLIAFGFTATGRYIVVVYDKIDEYTVYPVTAYDV